MARTVEHTEMVDPILTPQEAHEVFDRQVRRLMNGMSGEDFTRRWAAGEFYEIADQPGNRHIVRLAMMMPGGQSQPR